MRRAFGIVTLAVALAASGVAGGAAPGSGITGKVQASPTCPVETVPPQQNCAPKGIAASLRVRRYGRSTATIVRSGSDGRFRLRLVPATYFVQPLAPAGSPYPTPPGTRRVRVRTGHFTYITITYDTGIR